MHSNWINSHVATLNLSECIILTYHSNEMQPSRFEYDEGALVILFLIKLSFGALVTTVKSTRARVVLR